MGILEECITVSKYDMFLHNLRISGVCDEKEMISELMKTYSLSEDDAKIVYKNWNAAYDAVDYLITNKNEERG